MSPGAARGRPAVFLDRDGTLIAERGWVLAPEGVELLPGAGEAVARLNAAGYAVVLVTNQSAIARGLLDEEGLARIHARLAELLAEHGARLDRIEFCPDHPSEGVGPHQRESARRKPAPGMLLDAARALGLDLARSWMIGDAERDLVAGRRAGVRPILVTSGKGASELARLVATGSPPENHSWDLLAAAGLILNSNAAL